MRNKSIHGMAHITGGGIEGNLSRIMPCDLSARIDLSTIITPLIFKYIKSNGSVADNEMLKTFNCGVGFVIVVAPSVEAVVVKAVSKFYKCYTIGEVVQGEPSVAFTNKLTW